MCIRDRFYSYPRLWSYKNVEYFKVSSVLLKVLFWKLYKVELSEQVSDRQTEDAQASCALISVHCPGQMCIRDSTRTAEDQPDFTQHNIHLLINTPRRLSPEPRPRWLPRLPEFRRFQPQDKDNKGLFVRWLGDLPTENYVHLKYNFSYMPETFQRQ